MPESLAAIADVTQVYTERFRPQYHLSTQEGWLGDPDGMIRYRGLWHCFWWGHATSPDLVHWTEQPYPMVGDDGSFVYFSGSVVVDETNSSGLGRAGAPPIVAIYTMHDRDTRHETQGLSISHDGLTFTFFDGNPVLDADQPEFRDPQVFRDEASGRWIMAIVLPIERQVQFYASDDLIAWELLSECGPWGSRETVWEVPDLFEMAVDDDPTRRKWVLLCGMSPNRNQYFIGDFDGTTFRLDPEANAYLLQGQGIPGRVLTDFEQGVPDDWAVSGQPTVQIHAGASCDGGRGGWLGEACLSTHAAESTEPVELFSQPFTIDGPHIHFLRAGGGSDRSSVSLVVDDNTVRIDRGQGDPLFRWGSWKVADLIGQTARLRIVDSAPWESEGALAIDHIVLSSQAMTAGLEHANWLDAGPDYYAVRTYRDYDHETDRTIAMGWMGNWEYAQNVPTEWGKGYMAVPRDLHLRSWAGGLRLCQEPIAELTSLRSEPIVATGLVVHGSTPIPGFMPRVNQYELDLVIDEIAPGCRFGVRLAIGECGSIAVGYDSHIGALFLDRSDPETGGFSETFAKHISTPLDVASELRLRIFVDRASVEVFANDGEATISAAMFPDVASTGVEVFAGGGTVTVQSVTAWELASIWPSSTGAPGETRQ